MMVAKVHHPELYVHMVLDGLDLFIPQDDVLSVEIIADLELEQTEIGSIGWFGQHGHGDDAPVFCITGNFELLELNELPESREYFVLLKSLDNDTLPLGLTCDELEDMNVQKEHLYIQSVPAIMRTPRSPISELLIYQGDVACISSGPDMSKYLIDLSEQYMDKMAALEAAEMV
jgi:hypothetical protein